MRLDPEWTYHGTVCGFTFRFDSLEQIRAALEFYRRPIHATSRLPDPAWVEAAIRENPVGYRVEIDRFIHAEHDVIQRWYERLPLYLQEKSKRPRVVRALERALAEFA